MHHTALLLRALPVGAALLALAGCRDHSSPTEPQLGELSAPRPEYAGGVLAATNSWATRKPMPTPRGYLAAGVVNNILYAVGGAKSATGRAITKVEAYNATSNTWLTKAPLPVARQMVNGATAINGTLYIPGGLGYTGSLTRSLFAYSPATNSWSRKADLPVLSFGGTSVVINSKLYVTAGGTASSPGGSFDVSNRLYRYDPATDAWTELAPSPHAHFHAAGGTIGGKLYLAGGYDYDPATQQNFVTGALDLYNPATNTWTTKAPLPTPRFGATARAINQKLYVVGGVDPALPQGETDVLEVYDPASNTWTTRAPMPTARTDAAAGVLGGLLYVVGGLGAPQPHVALGTLEAYSP
jgi:N-acetylneuraminic acid mutarotase